jgi:hypothetical protein
MSARWRTGFEEQDRKRITRAFTKFRKDAHIDFVPLRMIEMWQAEETMQLFHLLRVGNQASGNRMATKGGYKGGF